MLCWVAGSPEQVRLGSLETMPWTVSWFCVWHWRVVDRVVVVVCAKRERETTTRGSAVWCVVLLLGSMCHVVVVVLVVVVVVVVAGGGDPWGQVVHACQAFPASLAGSVDGGAHDIQIVTSLILPVLNNLFVEQT